MSIDYEVLSTKLKVVIALSGKRMEGFAKEVGASRTTIYKMLDSDRQYYNADVIKEICRRFSISKDWLLSNKKVVIGHDAEILAKNNLWEELKEPTIKAMKSFAGIVFPFWKTIVFEDCTSNVSLTIEVHDSVEIQKYADKSFKKVILKLWGEYLKLNIECYDRESFEKHRCKMSECFKKQREMFKMYSDSLEQVIKHAGLSKNWKYVDNELNEMLTLSNNLANLLEEYERRVKSICIPENLSGLI